MTYAVGRVLLTHPLEESDSAYAAAVQIALVTGASSGIGAATARLLASAGYRVVLAARRESALRKVAAELAGNPVVEPLDASDGEAVEAMAERVRASVGIPDVIVNAAGAGAWKDMEETTPAEVQAMIGAPYLAAFHVTRAFLGGMLARGSGVIIHVGSPASAMAWPGATAYTAARWALRGLNEALVADLRGTGVRSCHVVFGRVSSAYFETNAGAEERMSGIARTIPRLSPEECARVILRTIRAPRREVFAPFMLRMYHAVNVLFPMSIRWTLAVTGRKRAAAQVRSSS